MEINSLLVFQNNIYFFILTYIILGAGIKYIDSAFDENVFNKKFAMLMNEISASILLAVLIAVIIKGKIDNIAHLLGVISIIIFGVLIIFFIDGNGFMFLPLIFLACAGIIDEVGNDVLDYNKKFHNKKRFGFMFGYYFFGRRYLMKVAILYLALLNVFPLYFLIAFILFDESYIIVDLYCKSKLA